jgi:low affinity Fe/Cu permease
MGTFRDQPRLRLSSTQQLGVSRTVFYKFSRSISSWAGRPATFGSAVAVVLLWACTGPAFKFSDTWQLVINTGTTIVTFLMVFLIQNTQNRDAAAVQLKLNELIRAMEGAQNRLIALEDATQEELDQLKMDYVQIAEDATPAHEPKLLSVEPIS